MGLKYSKETVSFQRKKINEILKRSYNFKKVSKKIYFQELKKSKILISPLAMVKLILRILKRFFIIAYSLRLTWTIWRLGQTFI